MSPDEWIVLLASGGIALVAWAVWYWRQYSLGALRSRRGRAVLLVAPILAAAIVVIVLETLASFDVRDDPRYLAMYFALGMAWIAVAKAGFTVAGVSARDDVLERGNASAAYAVAGGLVAIALCYAGGNIGDGPGWWVVVFAAGLATGSLFVAWLLLDVLSGVSDVVTIERDPAAGVRLGGFLIACGAIFGRAAAGDWVSAAATVTDFLIASQPVLLLLVIAVAVERVAKPTPSEPSRSIATLGFLPALAYLAVAAVQLLRLGVPA
jgi:hypothetical protein